jgi:hypothetical protein
VFFVELGPLFSWVPWGDVGVSGAAAYCRAVQSMLVMASYTREETCAQMKV